MGVLGEGLCRQMVLDMVYWCVVLAAVASLCLGAGLLGSSFGYSWPGMQEPDERPLHNQPVLTQGGRHRPWRAVASMLR